MKAILIIFLLLFSGCMDIDSNNISEDRPQDNIDNITDEIINEINNEYVVIYKLLLHDEDIELEKNKTRDNISINFHNPRNEDVNLLIPEISENKKDHISLQLENHEEKCQKNSECKIIFNITVREQSSLNDNFSFYLPITLLNDDEFVKFIEINKYEKYKEIAMKYITNRVYIKYQLNAKFKSNVF